MTYHEAHRALVGAGVEAKTELVGHRLLALVGDNGQVNMTWEEWLALCGCDNVNASRRHLSRLMAAGLIHYSTNDYVYVTWLAWMDVDDGTPRAETARSRADHGTPRAEIARPRADDGTLRAETARPRADLRAHALPAARPRAETSTTDVSLSVDTPVTGGQTNKQASAARSVALLTDAEVGLDARVAGEFAARLSFDEVVRHVFSWRRDVESGRVVGAGALVHRMRSRFGGKVLDADRKTPLWKRYCAEHAEESERKRYIPDEYRDIIIG